jgi:hypothetical protein
MAIPPAASGLACGDLRTGGVHLVRKGTGRSGGAAAPISAARGNRHSPPTPHSAIPQGLSVLFCTGCAQGGSGHSRMFAAWRSHHVATGAQPERLTSLRITKGWARTDVASLLVEGDGPAGTVSGEVLLLLEKGAWVVDSEVLVK